MITPHDALSRLTTEPDIVIALTSAALSIGRLDARVSVSPIASAWADRAAWSGYSRALQLQGVEIDEIDVFSWGCSHPIAGRQRRTSILNEFDAFPIWQAGRTAADRSAWRDRLPFTPALPADSAAWSALLLALDIMRQGARYRGDISAWLALPEILHGLGVIDTPLPCLVAGAKSFRLRATPVREDWRAVLRALVKAADAGLERLNAMEQHRRQSIAAVVAEHRPGALVRLAALTELRPILSPTAVAATLNLSLPGAGKLLSRAADLGLLVEVSGRRVWRTYLVPDLAITFGYLAAPRGRPAKAPPLAPADRSMRDALEAFDAEMRLLDAQLKSLGVTPDAA